jgi:hypothetical protein
LFVVSICQLKPTNLKSAWFFCQINIQSQVWCFRVEQMWFLVKVLKLLSWSYLWALPWVLLQWLKSFKSVHCWASTLCTREHLHSRDGTGSCPWSGEAFAQQ